MKRLLGFFLSRTLFEAWSLAAESQLDNIILALGWRILTAGLDYPFHIATFGSDKSSGDLEFLIVVYLYVEATREFHLALVVHLFRTAGRVTNLLIALRRDLVGMRRRYIERPVFLVLIGDLLVRKDVLLKYLLHILNSLWLHNRTLGSIYFYFFVAGSLLCHRRLSLGGLVRVNKADGESCIIP